MKLSHASDEMIERYALGNLEEPELSAFEEHLLICSECQERVETEDQFARTARAELARPPMNSVVQLPAKKSRLQPGFLWAGGLAAAACLAMMAFVSTQRPPASQEITLIAQRGSEVLPVVRSSAPVRLHIDTKELLPAAQYKVEVAKHDGSLLSSTMVAGNADHLVVDAGSLQAGVYWVRVHSAAGDLLREFPLNVQ